MEALQDTDAISNNLFNYMCKKVNFVNISLCFLSTVVVSRFVYRTSSFSVVTVFRMSCPKHDKLL